MKPKLLALILLSFVSLLWAAPKSIFDRSDPGLSAKTSGHTTTAVYGNTVLRNGYLEASLLSGGYFTLGTTSGYAVDSPLDDRCQLLYGHPYAMTSMPLIRLDGNWISMDDPTKNSAPHREGDTLRVTTPGSAVSITFELIASAGDPQIKLRLTVHNSDTVAHAVAPALQLDPALGGSDGSAVVGGAPLLQDTCLDGNDVVTLEERAASSAAKGIRLEAYASENTGGQIRASNWPDMHPDTDGAGLPTPSVNTIYDLCLRWIWPETDLAPGASRYESLMLTLKEPDFDSPVFMRWDLPTTLSTESDRLFPKDLLATLNLYNTTDTPLPVRLSTPSSDIVDIDAPDSTLILKPGPPTQIMTSGTVREQFEHQTLTLDLVCQDASNTPVDLYRRVLHVPAVPLVYTGLNVTIDSVYAPDFPEMNVLFKSQITETGRPILQLSPENCFLFHNGERMRDFTLEKYAGGTAQLADVVFVLDVSGSMQNEINAVRDHLTEFADSLVVRGYDYRIGVVTFSTTIDSVLDLTDTIDRVVDMLDGIELWGGVEDSPSALHQAASLSFRPGSQRTIIWITDESYPEHNYTRQEIVNLMLSNGITVHGVGPTGLKREWFDPIVDGAGGQFFDIDGNFRDILLSVTRIRIQDRFHVRYTAHGSNVSDHQITLELHTLALGGKASITWIPNTTGEVASLSCFPNPFNPQVTITVTTPDGARGDLSVYNILGQRIRQFSLGAGTSQQITWNARDRHGRPVGSGFYLIRLAYTDPQGKHHQKVRRILHLK
jgi:hypothetical protein